MAASLSFPRRLLRALLLTAGALFALAALALGLVIGLALWGWARLRGRPVLRVQAFRWPAARSGAEVVDVQAREVHDAAAGTLPVERLR
ncbi:MAG: hypothetical protein U1F56_02765 [Rubrivivax sp.]